MLSRSCAFALLLWAGPLAAQARPIVADTTLANGLTVIVLENHAVPLVNLVLDVRAGAFVQTADFEGLAHFYEHMFFKAKRGYVSSTSTRDRLLGLGAVWTASTAVDDVEYHVTVGTDSIRPAMEFFQNAIAHPLFLETDIETERPSVLEEMAGAGASATLIRAIDSLLWTPAYVSRTNVGGPREVIASVTPEKLRAIQDRYYVPNNTALVLSGDITRERGFQLAREIFGAWPRGADPFATPIPEPPPLTAPQAVIRPQSAGGSVLQVRWRGPSLRDDPEGNIVADLLEVLLYDPTTTFRRRLADRGLSAGVVHFIGVHAPNVIASSQVPPDKLLEARSTLLTELGHLADTTYVTLEQLARAKRDLVYRQTQERSLNWAITVGWYWAMDRLDYYRNYAASVQQITRTDIARFAKRYLIDKPYVVGALIAPAKATRIGLTTDKLLQGEVHP